MEPLETLMISACEVKTIISPGATKAELLDALRWQGEDLDALYQAADECRRRYVGEEVYIRGILEYSNICIRNCAYCGIRAGNRKVRRYLMTEEEMVECAEKIARGPATTIVLQAGESQALPDQALGRVIQAIKAQTPLAVTVSAGVRPESVYRFWRQCGMDRYLIRFETSDPELYRRVHPDSTLEERLEAIAALKRAGAQTGSGFLIGLPGETIETVASNLLLARDLDLDMIGVGPFIPHPDTPLAGARNVWADDLSMFYRVLAILRLLCPFAHIPATTAFDALFPNQGRDLALQRGANIFMTNHTPDRYRRDYLLYPGKPCADESDDACNACIRARLARLGRPVGKGPGHSLVHPPAAPEPKKEPRP